MNRTMKGSVPERRAHQLEQMGILVCTEQIAAALDYGDGPTPRSGFPILCHFGWIDLDPGNPETGPMPDVTWGLLALAGDPDERLIAEFDPADLRISETRDDHLIVLANLGENANLGEMERYLHFPRARTPEAKIKIAAKEVLADFRLSAASGHLDPDLKIEKRLSRFEGLTEIRIEISRLGDSVWIEVHGPGGLDPLDRIALQLWAEEFAITEQGRMIRLSRSHFAEESEHLFEGETSPEYRDEIGRLLRSIERIGR